MISCSAAVYIVWLSLYYVSSQSRFEQWYLFGFFVFYPFSSLKYKCSTRIYHMIMVYILYTHVNNAPNLSLALSLLFTLSLSQNLLSLDKNCIIYIQIVKSFQRLSYKHMYKICHICTYMCCESEKFNEKKKI